VTSFFDPMQLIEEVLGRLPCYLDDWTLPFLGGGEKFRRTLAASIFIFFASLGPAITFASFLAERTGNLNYGTNEILFSTGLSGVLYAIFAGQPLVIVGVTGPIAVFSETAYLLNERHFHLPFLSWMFWVGIWAGLFHMFLAVLGSCRLVRFVTPFTCDVFSALIGTIYIYTAFEQITYVLRVQSIDQGLLVLLLAFSTLLLSRWLSKADQWTALVPSVRLALQDYAVPVAVVLITLVYQLPVFHGVAIDRLPVASNFRPSNGRASWLVDPSDLPVWAIFAAIIPAFILTILIFFDHNVSSLMAQQQKGLRLTKPVAFNWDFFIVGLTMLLTSWLGLPFSHGLIPQAPLHVRALALTGRQVRFYHILRLGF
jgi:hypothetical protein